VFGLRDNRHRGTIVFLPGAAISSIFYKTQNLNQANDVRSRGKRQLRFEITGVKSQLDWVETQLPLNINVCKYVVN
jgi:hypothetical protein